jgi:hypothetical protein
VERAKRNPKEHLAPALEQLKNYVVEDGRFAAQALEGLQELAASRMEAAFAFIQLALDHPDLAMEAALKIDLSAFRERIEHPPPGDAAEAPKIASPDQDINMEERYVRLVVALAGLKNDAGVRHETAVADVIGVAWFGTSPIIGAKLRAKIRPSYVKLCEETLRTI